MKTIGVLGGMGPEASSVFYQMIIDISHEKYKAVQDTDYPPMIIFSLALKGFDERGIVNEKQVLSQLIEASKRLERSGSDFIVITCNTVHHFIEDLRKNVKIPILSIIEEVAKEINKDKIKTVGLLASESAIELDVYGRILKKNGINFIIPNNKEQKIVTQAILNVMTGKDLEKDKKELIEIINKMGLNGAKGVILGCTELPLIISEKSNKMKAYDTLKILAERSLILARQ